MEIYLYKAKDILNDKIVKGEIELESEEHVKKFLADKYLYPLSIRKKNALNSDLSEVGIFKKPIKLADIAFFCKQFGAMIEAGISIGRALEICTEQTTHPVLKKHLSNVHEQVNAGKTLSEACTEEKIFPDILVSMIECGEASGNLDVVLRQVVEHFDTSLATQRKLKKALIYPTIVMVIVVIVVIIMMIKVIPNFVGMFQEAEIELPLPTRMIIAVSEFFLNKGLVMLAILGGLIFAGCQLKKLKSVRKVLDKWALKLPLFGKLNKQSLAVLFSTTLAMLVSSGLPMLQAMSIVKRVLNNAVAEAEIEKAIEELKHGNTLHDALSGSQIYPPIMYSMISVGEQTGALDEMMVKIGHYFNEEVQMATDNLMVLIEPALTIFIAFIIGGIMLGIILPTFRMAEAMM